MIVINLSVTGLAAGYALIDEFVATLESTWLPGFARSYQRRTAEYQQALEKYENRGLFMRTLLRKPKKPNRPPPQYKNEVSARLHEDWIRSFTAETPASSVDFDRLHEVFDDDFLMLTGIRLKPDLAAHLLALGPPGIIEVESGNSQSDQPSPPQQIMQETAVAIRHLLRSSKHSGVLIHAGSMDYWQQNIPGIDSADKLDQPAVFAIADTLLAHHQELSQAPTFSALTAAEKLTKREKDTLLQMAATL